MIAYNPGIGQSCAVFFRNLGICDLWINHENMQIFDLRTGTEEICRFAIAE
jgi:hypothetical protein